MDDEHSAFCIKSIVRSNIPIPDIKIKENFEFGDALESVYPLLDIIFDYLNNKDLDNVSRVKKSWEEIAQRILKKRQTISWVSCYNKHKRNFVTHSDNLLYSSANIGIILFDYRRLRLNKYICLHNKDNDKLVRMTFAEYLTEEIIGKNVSYCLLPCPKVVSLFTNHEEYMNGSIFDGILLPEIPGIRTTMFYCNPVKLKNDASLLEEYIKPSEEIKCVLFFALSDSHRSIYNLFQVFFQETKPEGVAVGGGIIPGSKSFHTSPNSIKKVIAANDIFCITFLKESGSNPKFNAASFVINGNDLSKQEFHEKVLHFKKRVIIRNHSVGFRICCGAKWEKDEESIIFHKHFPNTPLLGLEADGEIGWNCFNLPNEEDYPESKPKKSKKPFPKVEHEWSTVFVIVTWGEILKDKL